MNLYIGYHLSEFSAKLFLSELINISYFATILPIRSILCFKDYSRFKYLNCMPNTFRY